MRRVFVYHRVSSDQQAERGGGMERQAKLLEDYLTRTKLCDDMDDPEPIVLGDPGMSAFKGHNLQHGELGTWVDQVKAGMWDGSILVLESIDRFSRLNPFEVLDYLNSIIERNVSIHDVYDNNIINRRDISAFTRALNQADRAFKESKYKSDRISAGWRRKREQAFNNGTIVTKKRPVWIDVVDNKYVLNEKAAVVKEIFRLYQTGIGCPTIAKILQKKEGSEWKFDRAWSSEHVHKILRNKRVTGKILISEIIRDYETNDKEKQFTQNFYDMDVYPVVIDEKEFELVQELLKSRRPNAGRATTKKDGDQEIVVKHNMFSGIFRCGDCGQGMFHNVVKTKRNPKKSESRIEEYRYIRCIVERDDLCHNKAMDYTIIEKFLIGRIKNLDFSEIIKVNEVNPEVELVRLQIEQEKAHIQDYELGIERLLNAGKRVSFGMRQELDEAKERLELLESRQAAFETVSVDTDVFTNFDMEELIDITNVGLRSRYERELAKVVDRIELRRRDNLYFVSINYKSTDLIKHWLVIENGKKKGAHLRGDFRILKDGDTVYYGTDSFVLSSVNDSMPRIHFIENEPLNMIDYAMLLNFIDYIDQNHTVAVWMRHNMNFLFMDTSD
ncbi:recombinase family protein [Klebsiella michiganensis]|uniref:recombinase family protein n=2 Tax=Enterobacteriaceae TaxID=543 RepID=UPI0027EBFCDF|nr:recombinase family protein [Klebsiella michiganensis]MDQ7853652.1 recombinase family protein [Klebsiella michiganensis]HED2752181.1 recombinase family protein [Enterobacter hormaechei subsp. steigerwaltii]